MLLEVRDARRLPAVRGVSLQVRAGEVVGLGGLVGSGRTELLRLIYGLDPLDEGEIVLEGKPLRAGHPRAAIRRGLGLHRRIASRRRSSSTGARRRTSRSPTSVAFSHPARHSKGAGDRAEGAESAEDRAGRPGPRGPLLSGGNQQKVVLARWLLRQCRVLLLDEPTRGVDVATKAEIYRIISELAASGLGVLVVSSELEELAHICTRVLVMREGEIVAEVDGKDATERALLRHAVAPTDAPDLVEEVV